MSLLSGVRVIGANWAPAFATITSAVKLPAFRNQLPLLYQAVPLHQLHACGINASIDQPLGFRRRATTISASGDGGKGAGASSFKLIVYSKEDCPLCDKLKEKLDALVDRAAYMPSILSDAEIEIRDISTNPTWQAAYSMSVPVLAVASPDGSNEVGADNCRDNTCMVGV